MVSGQEEDEPVLNQFTPSLVLSAAFTVAGVLFFGCYAIVVAVTS